MELVDRAIRFAAEAHSGQTREGPHPLPYITHPLEVMQFVYNLASERRPEVLAAAVLHDTLEETEATERDLASLFGPRVTELVKMLTRREPDPALKKQIGAEAFWQLRSDWMLEGIRSEMDPEAHSIKLADRLSNLREAAHTKSGPKLRRYLDQTDQILVIIGPAAAPALFSSVSALSERLRASV